MSSARALRPLALAGCALALLALSATSSRVDARPARVHPISLLAVASPPAPSQGSVIESYDEIGLRIPRPNGYLRVPIPPIESNTVLRFVEKSAHESLNLRARVVEVLTFDSASAQEVTWRAAVARRVASTFGPLSFPGESALRFATRQGDELELFLLHPVTRSRFVALPDVPVWVCRRPDRLWIIVGTDADSLDSASPWMHALRELRFAPPAPPDVNALASKLAAQDLSHPLERARVHASAIPGWSLQDTPRFTVLYHTGNKPFVNSVCKEVEELRDAFQRIFPPLNETHRLSTVRICHDMAEYLAYGGPFGTGGFWSPDLRELVLFDNARRNGLREWTNADTRSVLFHECFHQYVFDAAGQLTPPPWFGEGMGEYFAGAELVKGELLVHPMPKRLERAKVLAESRALGWQGMLATDQAALDGMSSEAATDFYSQAWSMAWFLMRAPAVKARPEWARIPARFYETLKTEYRVLGYELLAAGRDDRPEARREAASAAIDAAHRAAFEGVDMEELEEAWREFLRGS